MTSLVVRRLLIDLEKPFDRHWCGGDAFQTAFFNALSMSFPLGEQFFIDSVREGLNALPEDKKDLFKEEVQNFIGQEATHRRIHSLFNTQLAKQGLVDKWSPKVAVLQKLVTGIDVRHKVAITAANEHITAIFAYWLLSHTEVLEGSEERFKTMWLWHSAEEDEHKSTAFDLYMTLSGDYQWRMKWFRRATFMFFKNALSQTFTNLSCDGTLWKFSTWKSGWKTLLGKNGLIRQVYPYWKEYFKEDFHPRQQNHKLAEQWLGSNQEKFSVVGNKVSAV